MMAGFDHAVSVSMYSALALIGGLLAPATGGHLDHSLEAEMHASLSDAAAQISSWRAQIETNDWLDFGALYYFLGRGGSTASCHEGRLLWEEAAKVPASAMPTGSFRHGPQEIVREGLRVGLWIDGETLRAEDLVLAADLRRLGARVLLIGHDIPFGAGDLVLKIPSIRAGWQFLVDIIPIQIAAECLARSGDQDCDSFRLCSYIVDQEGGLLDPRAKLEGATRR